MLRNSTQKFRQRYNSSSKKSSLTSIAIGNTNREFYQANSVTLISNIKRSASTRKLEQSIRYKQSTATTPISAKSTQKSQEMHLRALKSWKDSASQISKFKILQKSIPINLKPKEKLLLQQNQSKKRDPEQFIENLTKNSIFFCCQCYQYVFEIQKKRHFPDCKDTPSLELKGKQLSKFFQIKLDKILQLSKYTGTKTAEVEQLYNQIVNNQYCQISLIKYPADCQFLSLEQILEAFAFTSNKLLQNPIDNKSSLLSCF